ncbi:RES domain-containing protein [Streptomyces sp. NE06-03E]|uniref:RES domain-containing protein n=1 Tax=Streptomyces sp. gb1(2016) TaxID=1828321 RepID=A0A652KUY8_9ACTN|nr:MULTISPECIES: RES domain-containing protein [unclassified Streptomyces]MDX3055619.1 RES domain-containing protein [Streptomyces sp. NE06-03E]TXS27387.1 RES domain-containing protein [Streptomyces sp. gb1(2016)]
MAVRGDQPDVRLIPAPERGVWRLGKVREPLRYEQIGRDDADSSAGNQWSLVGYGTLYCASEQVGCLAEALAPFRVHPDWRDLAAADWEDGAPGLVPPDWPTRHTLERLELSKDARFLDVDDERTLTTLSDELRETLRLNGVDKLSRDHIEGFNRKITRAISAWAISQREPEQGGRLVHGIAYRSRLGMHQCWAVYNDVAFTRIESNLIFPEDTALRSVVEAYDLRLR